MTNDQGELISADEGIRRGTTVDVLAGLKTVFKPDGGVITAGNSSQISDGSAALLMTTSDKARELGLTPIARVHTAVLAGADPIIMLTAPIPATRKALARSGLGMDEIGAFEVNEAFAPVPLAWLAETGRRPQGAELQRRGHRPRPPAGRVRRAADDHPRAPHARQRHPLRPADHVRGRRPGQRHHPRTPLTWET